MKYRKFSSEIFSDSEIPFRKKKLVFFILTWLLTVNFAAATDAAQAVVASEARQQIRQAEKMTRKGEPHEAEKILRGVIARSPNDSAAKLALSYALLKQRQLLEAYNFSAEIARSEPKNAHAFAVLGAVMLAVGNFIDAKRFFINAVKLNNKEALAWSGYGMLDFYENRIAASLDNLRQAVYLNPREPDFYYNLAQVSARAEKYKEAAEAYRKYLQIAPPTDAERRDRIKGLVNFLRFLGNRDSLYNLDGAEKTNVAFKLLNDRPVIELYLEKNSEPLKFILDTGSGVSVLSEATAQRLNIKPITRGGMARGIGGEGKFEIIYGFLRSIYIGDVQIKSVPIYIRKFTTPSEQQIDGYIGLSLISKFLTTIDYGNRTFALAATKASANQLIKDAPQSLPLRLTSSGFLSGEVNLEGIESPLNFIVDTGASVSVISDELANSKEISCFVRNEKMKVFGAAGVTNDVPSFLLPRVTFGTHSRQSVTAVALDLNLINETSGFEQAGILGGNFLKNYRLTFDFQNSKVVFEPVK